MELYEELIALGFKPVNTVGDGDFELCDEADGLGPYINVWNCTQPCPFPDKLDIGRPVLNYMFAAAERENDDRDRNSWLGLLSAAEQENVEYDIARAGGLPKRKVFTAEDIAAHLNLTRRAPIAAQPTAADVLDDELETALQQDAAKPEDVELFPPAIAQIDKDRAANARLLHKDDDLNPQAPSDWDMDGQEVVEEEADVAGEPMPDALRDSLARLVEPDANQAAKKAALMTRWINLKAQMEDKKLPERDRKLPPISLAEIAEFEQLERYMGWFK